MHIAQNSTEPHPQIPVLLGSGLEPLKVKSLGFRMVLLGGRALWEVLRSLELCSQRQMIGPCPFLFCFLTMR